MTDVAGGAVSPPTAPPLAGPTVDEPAVAQPDLPALGRRPRTSRALTPPSVRPDTLEGARRRAGPSRMDGAASPRVRRCLNARAVPGDQRAALLGHDTGWRARLPQPRHRPRRGRSARARRAVPLPYRWARMRYQQCGPTTFCGTTPGCGSPAARARIVVVRAGEPHASTDLDHFLSARWGLHVAPWWSGRTIFVPNEHPNLAAAHRRGPRARRPARRLRRPARPDLPPARPRRLQRRRPNHLRPPPPCPDRWLSCERSEPRNTARARHPDG